MADNLAITTRCFVGIHALVGHDPLLGESLRVGGPLCVITHDMFLVGRSIPRSFGGIARPGVIPGLLLWFGAASRVGRWPGGKGLVVGDDVFFVLSWTDVLGSGHGRRAECKLERGSRYVGFLQLAGAVESEDIMECLRATRFERGDGEFMVRVH